MTQGHQLQLGLSQCSQQPFSENRVQIGASARLEFCSQADSRTDTQRDKQTHRQTNFSEDITPPRFRGGVIDKKHLENGDTSTFVTFDM